MHKMIRFVELPTVIDDCHMAISEFKNLPFKIKRIYYIYKPKKALGRGFHAHKQNRQILFCLHGSVKLLLDNGIDRESVLLNDPSQGIILDRMIWHEMLELQQETILLVLASDNYDEKDYIRDYSAFRELVQKI